MIPGSYDNSFFDFQRMQSYKSASIILPFVNQWIRPGSVIDVGCGVGAWLKATEALHIETIAGLDGSYVPADKLLISKDQFTATDLEKEVKISRKYDLAMCLEVAEHLSNKRAGSFIAELCALSDVILFSAAVPGQEGTLHINEQYPDYWIDLFKKNNYTCFDCLRPVIWKNKEIEFWYKQNIMLFIKNEAIDKYPVLKELPSFNGNSIIHPELFDYKTNKAEYYRKLLHNPVKLVRYYLSKIYHSIVK
jgi:hypothetical protein